MAWRTLSPMPTARQGLAAAALNGLVYAIGGGPVAQPPYSTVEAYDPTTDTWTSKTPIDSGISGVNAHTYAGQIVLIGWMGSQSLCVTRFYDDTTNTWSSGSSFDTGTLGPNSTALVGGRIYVASEATDLWYYDPGIDVWGDAGHTQLTATQGFATASLDQTIHFVDGLSGNIGVLDHWVYDTTSGSWTQAKSMYGIGAVSNAALVPLGKGLLLIGGTGGNPSMYRPGDNALATSLFYNPENDSWSFFPDMAIGRENIAAVSLNGVIYVLGGTDSTSVLYDDNEVFDPADLGSTANVKYGAKLDVTYNVQPVGWSNLLSQAFVPYSAFLPASVSLRSSGFLTVYYYAAPPPTLDVSFLPVEDAFVWEEFPRINYGDEQDLVVGLDQGFLTRAFLKFDISSLESGLRIRRATLTLYSRVSGPNISVYGADDNWSELGITWDNQPARGPQALDTKLVPIGYVDFDVTNQVLGWYDGTITTRSLALVKEDETQPGQADFRSRETTIQAYRPVLTITYDNPSGGVGKSDLPASGTVRQFEPTPVAAPPHNDLASIGVIISPNAAMVFAQPTLVGLAVIRVEGQLDLTSTGHVAPGPGSDVDDLVGMAYIAGPDELISSADVTTYNTLGSAAMISLNNTLSGAAIINQPELSSLADVRPYDDLATLAQVSGKLFSSLTALSAISTPNLPASSLILVHSDQPAVGDVRVAGLANLISRNGISRKTIDAQAFVRPYQDLSALSYVRPYVGLPAQTVVRKQSSDDLAAMAHVPGSEELISGAIVRSGFLAAMVTVTGTSAGDQNAELVSNGTIRQRGASDLPNGGAVTMGSNNLGIGAFIRAMFVTSAHVYGWSRIPRFTTNTPRDRGMP